MFRKAGLEVDEDELDAVAAEALAVVRPRYRAASPDRKLAALLAEAGFDVSPPAPGEVERLVAREALALAALVTDSLTVTEAATRLRVDPSRIRQRLARRTLYGFKAGGRDWRLPAWQFVVGGAVRGLGPVLGALDPALDPVGVTQFMLGPHDDLLVAGEPVSPVAWLTAGRDPAAVAELARWLTAA